MKAKGLICTEEGCESAAAAKGLCRLHYQHAYAQRVRRNSEFKPRPRFDRNEPCLVKGCVRPVTSLGMCSFHYHRQKTYGNPLAERPTRTRPDRVIPQETSPSRLAKILGVTRQRAEQILNPIAHKARAAVDDALKIGQLTKPTYCERCDRKTNKLHAHHWDYKEELDVRWVCRPCHMAIHVGIRKRRRAA